MHGYFRVLTKDPEMERLTDLDERIREFFSSLPGIIAVKSVHPHGRGGFSVTVDREQEMPNDFETRVDLSDFLLVI
jgi:hypothetical protein